MTHQLLVVLAVLLLLQGAAGVLIVRQVEAADIAQESAFREAVTVSSACQRLANYANQEVVEVLGYLKGAVPLERIDRTRLLFRAEAGEISDRLEGNPASLASLGRLKALEHSLFEVETGTDETLFTLLSKSEATRDTILEGNNQHRALVTSFMWSFRSSNLNGTNLNQSLVELLVNMERERDAILDFSPARASLHGTNDTQVAGVLRLNDEIVQQMVVVARERLHALLDRISDEAARDAGNRTALLAIHASLTREDERLALLTGNSSRALIESTFRAVETQLAAAETFGIPVQRRPVPGVGDNITSLTLWKLLVFHQQELRRNFILYATTSIQLEEVVREKILPKLNLLREEADALSLNLAAAARNESSATAAGVLQQTKLTVSATVGGVVVPVGIAGTFTVTRLYRRVRAFDDAAGHVAQGDFTRPPPPLLGDDFDPLAKAWGSMTSGLMERERVLTEQTGFLRQNERMAALGGLLAGVAHEINNPLTFIKGNEEVAREDIDDLLKRPALANDPEVRQILESLREGIDINLDGMRRIEATNRALKGYASPVDNQREPVDLNEVVEGALIIAHNRLKGRFKVQRQFHVPMPIIQGSAQELGQIILNLLINAADASPPGGTITLTTSVEDGRVVLRAKDEGPGIDPRVRATLFTPFATTKKHGTGLGLHISRGIAEAHGGSLSTEAAEKGACFVLALPVEAPAAPPAREPQNPVPIHSNEATV